MGGDTGSGNPFYCVREIPGRYIEKWQKPAEAVRSLLYHSLTFRNDGHCKKNAQIRLYRSDVLCSHRMPES